MYSSLSTALWLALAALAAVELTPASTVEVPTHAAGQGCYLLGPGMPTVFSFDPGSMSCSVSWLRHEPTTEQPRTPLGRSGHLGREKHCS